MEENKTVEIDLPDDSIIKKLLQCRADDGQSFDENNEIKSVEKTISDEDYNAMLSEFLEKAKKQAELNKPENRLKHKIMIKENERKRSQFRGL
jgi:hypothetical protein